MNGVLSRGKMARLDSLVRRLKWAFPTLQGQDVYVLLVIRIRSDQAGYTLQAKGLVTLVLVVLVKMKTRLERTGGSRWSLKHSELGVPEVVKRPQRIAFSQIPDRE